MRHPRLRRRCLDRLRDTRINDHRLCASGVRANAVEELFALMQGSFDSKAQAELDSAFYAISLHMHQVWPERGHFLYAQALASMQEKPYRQRIYQLKAEGDEVASYVYKLPADSLWIGQWREPASFETLTLEDWTCLKGARCV